MTKLLLPFITIPIVSKALGPSGIGMYNYTNSIAQYFVLVAGLGIGVYGNREIAINRDDEDKLSKTFNELYRMNLIISLSVLIIYLIFTSFSPNRLFFYFQSLIIVGAVFDVSWFFMGIEDFKKSSLSSLGSQVVCFFLIIIFIKDSSDTGTYIFIQSLNILLSQLIMWLFILKKVSFVKVKFIDIKKHFVPALQFFFPKVAILLYTNLNKTLLGWMDSKAAVGLFSNTTAITGMIVTLITTVDLVLLPKMSNLIANKKIENVLKIIKLSLHFQIYFTIPIMFGLFIITPNFVPWFFGEEFNILIKTIPLVSPLVIIIPLGMAIGRQYILPFNRMRSYNGAIIVGAVISIIVNISLIPFIGMYGALIATILAETAVTIIRVVDFRKNTDFNINGKYVLKVILCASLMYVIVTNLLNYFSGINGILLTILQTVLGVVVYLVLTTIIKINPLWKFYQESRNRGGNVSK